MNYGLLSLNINTDDLNYGAVLHSWAFQQVLENVCCEGTSEIIDYIPTHLENFDRRKPVVSYAKRRHWKNVIKLLMCRKRYLSRLDKFERFIDEKMTVSKEQFTEESLNSALLDYDTLVCESDVIWSPGFFGGKFERAFFLNLDSMRTKRRYAYSASAANMVFSENQKKEFSILLRNFDGISCRESYLSNYIESNEGIDAPHVLDPVLLLDQKCYESIMSERLIKEKYLLIYIPVQLSSEVLKEAEKYARKNGLRIVEISMFLWNGLRHEVIVDAGIEEFLSLIYYADCIFTSSFHAVCFSLLFHKNFFAFKRKTGKKTEDLCRTFAVEERYIDGHLSDSYQPIDFELIQKVLNKKRDVSLSYIRKQICGMEREN